MDKVPPYDKIGVTPAPDWVNASPQSGTPGSIFNVAAINALQAEVLAVQDAAGETRDSTNLTQLLRAVRSGALEYYADTGIANAPTIAPTPAHTSLVDGLHFRVKMAHAPTGAGNLFVNSLEAPVLRRGAVALTGGEWAVGDIVDLVYSASEAAFQLCGLTVNDVPGGSGGSSDVNPSQGDGCCRLSVTSGTVLTMTPYDGNRLVINGVRQTIPSAGITISNAGTATSTLYYVYAAMSSGSMILELATTGWAFNVLGQAVKAADPTQRLVGMIATNPSGQFQDAGSFRGCLNYFNRRTKPLNSASVAVGSTGSTSFVVISTAANVSFLTWADEAPLLEVSGDGNNVAGNGFNVSVGVDGVAVGNGMEGVSPSTGYNIGFTANSFGYLSEGLHVATPMGDTGNASYTSQFDLSVYGSIRG